MKNDRTQLTIHLFALLHMAVSLTFRYFGFIDTLVLTVLSVAMILIICLSRKVSFEFTAASIIFVNGFGYIFGTLGAEIVQSIITYPSLVHPITTFFTTEIIGWSMVAIIKLFNHDGEPTDWTWDRNMNWLILATIGIIVARFGIAFLFEHDFMISLDIPSILGLIFGNAWAVVILLCINMLAIRWKNNLERKKAIFAVTGCLLASGTLVALITRYDFPFKNGSVDSGVPFSQLFIVAMITNIVAFSLIYMVDYAMVSRRKIDEERNRANYEHYRYQHLKEQMNPHFLFNSLNILDCLVMDGRNEEASGYIRKLAGIYRYIIRGEEVDTVKLSEEMKFVDSYVELLQIRFPEGFKVIKSIPEADLDTLAVPCAVQLLIENAIKHNSVDASDPSEIAIESDGEWLRVRNTLRPKVSAQESTHLGLKYITRQYEAISGKQIIISQTEKHYTVELPLVKAANKE